MSRRRIVFAVLLIMLLLAAWWLLRAGSEGTRASQAIKAVPARIANLSVPMSNAWEAQFRLPGTNAELNRFGTPVGALGAQPDGTIFNVTANGIVEVSVPLLGSDQQAARLIFVPNVDLAAMPPDPRVRTWRCVSDNLPSVTQFLPECSHVLADQRTAILAEHGAQLESAAAAFRSPEPEPEAESTQEPVPEAVPADAPAQEAPATDPQSPAANGPAVSLTPEEVDRALRGGQSLEQALADKRRTVAP